MNSEVQWFCSLAIAQGLLTAEMCQELLTLVGEDAELLDFGQQVVDLQLVSDLDRFHTLMTEAYSRIKEGPPPPLPFHNQAAAAPAPASRAQAPASPQQMAAAQSNPGLAPEPIADEPPMLEMEGADDSFLSRLPSVIGAENLDATGARSLMEDLLSAVREVGASDLRLVAGAPPCVIMNLEHRQVGDHVLNSEAAKRLNFAMLTAEQQARLAADQVLNLALTQRDQSRVRVNIFSQHHGYSGTYHMVPDNIRSLTDLGFENDKVISRLLEHQQGLILVAGPVGNGKTSTLAALVDAVNHQRRAYIVTIEDPVEILYRPRHAIISQREIGTNALSFHRAVTAALHLDPDLIVIADLRDLEMIEMALEAADAGHLVLGTVNTSDAASTLALLLEAVPQGNRRLIRERIAENLRGIVCQRLIMTAFESLTLATEVLVNSDSISKLIWDGKMGELGEVMTKSEAQGMRTMGQSVYNLYEQGTISAETALSNLRDPALIRRIVADRLRAQR